MQKKVNLLSCKTHLVKHDVIDGKDLVALQSSCSQFTHQASVLEARLDRGPRNYPKFQEKWTKAGVEGVLRQMPHSPTLRMLDTVFACLPETEPLWDETVSAGGALCTGAPGLEGEGPQPEVARREREIP